MLTEVCGVERVVMDNPGCLMHIRGGLHAAGRPQRASHIAEILAECLTTQTEGRV